jgi:hypothetical protein
VWVLALVTVVSVAAAGRLVAGPPEPRVAAVAIGPGPSTAVVTEVPAIAPPPDVIILSSPAAANTLVTTRELEVRGYLRNSSGTIRVTLEARGNRIIDQATIVPALAYGERPMVGRHPRFETRFGLPNPRPNGRMILQIALLDEGGRILDVIRRPFLVGPLLEAEGA